MTTAWLISSYFSKLLILRLNLNYNVIKFEDVSKFSTLLSWNKNKNPTSFTVSQYLLKYIANFVLVFHISLSLRATIVFSLSSNVSERAIFLKWHNTSFFTCDNPFSLFVSHWSQACSRWKSHMKTRHAILKKWLEMKVITTSKRSIDFPADS